MGTAFAAWSIHAARQQELKEDLQITENDVAGYMEYAVEDEATGLKERIVIESKAKGVVPAAHIVDEDGNTGRTYNFPINGHISVDDGQVLKAGDILVKIPRVTASAGDITGGLPPCYRALRGS